MTRRIYLDNNATTRTADEVREAMLPFFDRCYGNPSSLHGMGREAAEAVEGARKETAALLRAHPDEIVFTAGGTESDNLALRGVLRALPGKRHLVTTRVEHAAVLNTCWFLEDEGIGVGMIDVETSGRLDLDQLRSAVREETAVVSVMGANNETGVAFPLEEVARIAHEKGAILHVDAVQAAGKIPLDCGRMNIDLLSISAHKIHGPKGVGALYIRRGTPFASVMTGGHQEEGRRPGTENVPGIVGLGRACGLIGPDARLTATQSRIEVLRDRMERELAGFLPGMAVNGAEATRVANTSSLSFEGIEGGRLPMELDRAGIAVSARSACDSGTPTPSHVLLAMRVPNDLACSALRISLSRYTTPEEVDRAIEVIVEAVRRLRR
jgi:cysteine desulfurase